MAYGNDSNTVLLIHSNNADGSQLFADASQAGNGGNRHALTAVGDIAHSTATTKPNLGGSTVSITTSGYLSIPAHADFYYASGNFTIDLWFYAHALGGFNIGLVSQYVDTNNYFTLELNGASLRFNSKLNGTSLLNQTYLLATLLPTETWHHAALVRNGNQIALYLNGIQKDTATVVTNPPQYNAPLLIGTKSGSSTFTGHWTELRISKGIARTDFPVTFPYTSANYALHITSPGTSLITAHALGNHLATTATTTPLIVPSLVAHTTVTLASSETSNLTHQVITSNNLSVSNPSEERIINTIITSSSVTADNDTTSVIMPSPLDSTPLFLATSSVAAVNTELSSQSVAVTLPSDILLTAYDTSNGGINDHFTSSIVATPNTVSMGDLHRNLPSGATIQNSAVLPIQLACVFQLTGDIPLQIATSLSFNATLKVKPTMATILAYTSRQNIVLKIKEGLHGGVTIAGVNYEITQVEGTTDFRGLLTEEQVSSTPSIFVAYLQTRASDNQVLGFNTRQQVEDFFAIFLVADNVTDEYGINAMDIIRAMHQQVLACLLNWQLPVTSYERPMMPLIYRGGMAYGLESDSHYWRDDFSCTSQICSLQAQPMF